MDGNLQRSQLVGFVLRRVPGIAQSYIPALNGLTVLYGLNGVGKSRILRAIESVWTGEASGASALVRVPAGNTTSLDDDPLLGNLALAWRPESVVTSMGLPTLTREFDEIFGDVVADQIQPLDEHAADPYLGPLPEDRISSIQNEMMRQRLVAVTPTGGKSRAAWTVCPAAMESPEFPAISRELRRSRDGYRLYESGARAPHVRSDYDPEGPAFQYGPEDQLIQSSAFEWVGGNGPGVPLVGFAVRGDDRRVSFQLSYLGIDRPSLDRDGLQQQLATELSRVGVVGKRGRVTKKLLAAVARIEEQANIRYGSVLRDAPLLRLELRPIGDWFTREAIEWRFGESRLPLDAMSTAQLKWATWAIGVALHSFRYREWSSGPPSLIVLDEPEAALHRSAEAHMARSLNSFSAESGNQVVVATHSPELIDLPGARVIEVSRGEGTRDSVVDDLRPVDLEALGALGLNPSDLLRRQHGFLLLEGQHDEVLLETWVGGELRDLRVEILPLRGGSKLPGTIESRVLFDFTTAHLFVLLDNIDSEEIQDAWVDAQARWLADGPGPAGEALRGRLGRKPEERIYLGTWLSRALERGVSARVSPHGLKERDIIEYLPAGALVPGASDWRILRREHATALESGSKHRDFKSWLTATKKARINAESLVRAAMDGPVPSEITAFVEAVRRQLSNYGS